MANYYGVARTNYFRVKDEAAFRAWAANYPVEIQNADDGFCLLPDDSGDGSTFPNAHPETGDEIDFFKELSAHLTEDSIVVHMESGHEKLRYIIGIAEAYNHKGECVQISLTHIYDLAEKKFGHKPTPCEY